MDSSIVELERALLGAVLFDPKSFHKIKGLLNGSEFFDKKNHIIFNALNHIYEKGFEDVEIAPLVEYLKRNNQFNDVGQEYIEHLVSNPGLPSNVNKYVKNIIENYNFRQVKEKINLLNKQLSNGSLKDLNVNDILEKVELDILSITRDNKVKEFVTSKDGINNAIKHLEKRATGNDISGIPVDLPSIDKITGGFQRGDLIILAARPSMGKTALALNMAVNASINNKVAFFSLEMPTLQLYNRIISATAFIDGNKFRTPKFLTDNEWKKIYIAKERIEKMQLFIDDTPGIKISELIWKAKQLHKNSGIDMLVVDYLQLITASSSSFGRENRQAEVSVISRSLKKLARELDIPVIALSQLSRKVEARENKMPIMSDIRESGAIEQDADIISFVYRESYYHRGEKEVNENLTDIIIAKHRNGALGNIKLFFKPEHGLFTEAEKEFK